MKVLLVQPRASAEAAYPLGLAQLASTLEAAGHEILGADLCFDTPDRVLRRAQDAAVDWVGASVLAHTALAVGGLFRRMRLAHRGGLFVQGAWPTLDPAAALASTGADVALVGDPEHSALRLLDQGIPTTPTPGVATARAGVLITGGLAPRVPMDSLPLPDRRIFPIERYSFAMRALATPYAGVFTSRGCPRACPWCGVERSRPTGWDGRSPEAVVAELSALAEHHGVRSALVEDDCFLADPLRVRAICELLIARRLPLVLELVMGVRPDQADPDLFPLMARAGIRRVVFGFEHIGDSPWGCSPDQAERAVGIARDAGMRIGGYFVCGLPGVHHAQELRSALTARGLGLDDANFVPYYPAPGAAWTVDGLPGPAADPARAAWSARVAQALFFAQPHTLGRMVRDLLDEPRTLAALGSKAWELARDGGPVPVRDNP